VQALVDASRGDHTEAKQLGREAVAFAERTDAPNLEGDALTDLAEVLHAAGQSDETEATLTQALERYEKKMNLAQAAQTRARLAELRDGGTPWADVSKIDIFPVLRKYVSMARVKVTYVVDEDVARATRVHAARMDRRDSEVVEAALRSYLGLGLLDELWAAAAGLPPVTLNDVVDEQHAARAEQ
jgi:hypothetical protein